MKKEILEDLKKRKEALDLTIELVEKMEKNSYISDTFKNLLESFGEKEETIQKNSEILKNDSDTNVTIHKNSFKGKGTVISTIYQILSENYPKFLTVDTIVEKLKKEHNLIVLRENVSCQLSARLRDHNDLEKDDMNRPVKWRVKNKLITTTLRQNFSEYNLKSRVFNFIKFIDKGEKFSIEDLKEAQKIVKIPNIEIEKTLSTYLNTYISLLDKSKGIYEKIN